MDWWIKMSKASSIKSGEERQDGNQGVVFSPKGHPGWRKPHTQAVSVKKLLERDAEEKQEYVESMTLDTLIKG